MTIAYDTFETAIEDWAKAVTGFRFYWLNRKRNREFRKTWGTLQVISERDVGIDEVRQTDLTGGSPPAGGEIEVMISGNREITVSVQVKSRDQEPLKTARFFLAKLRTSLRKPGVRATHFQPNDIAVVRPLPLNELDFTRQNRVEALANMDVIFATVVNEVDPAEATTFIETVRVSSDVKNPGGVSIDPALQLDDFDIPQP